MEAQVGTILSERIAAIEEAAKTDRRHIRLLVTYALTCDPKDMTADVLAARDAVLDEAAKIGSVPTTARK
jgi:hypothetical protein